MKKLLLTMTAVAALAALPTHRQCRSGCGR